MKPRVHVFELNRGALTVLILGVLVEGVLLFAAGFWTGDRWLRPGRESARAAPAPTSAAARAARARTPPASPASRVGTQSRSLRSRLQARDPRQRARDRALAPVRSARSSAHSSRRGYPPHTRSPATRSRGGAAGDNVLMVRFDRSQPVPDTPYGSVIYRAARRHEMNPTLVAAVAWAESSFDPEAVSAKGARGLMQVMPDTAGRFGVAPADLFDPESNVDAGTRYLSWLADRFSGDLERILAAYNAGEAAVEEHGGVPPYAETRGFVSRVYSKLGLEGTAE